MEVNIRYSESVKCKPDHAIRRFKYFINNSHFTFSFMDCGQTI